MFLRSIRSQLHLLFHTLGFQFTFICVLLIAISNSVVIFAKNINLFAGYSIDVSQSFLLNADSPLCTMFCMLSMFLLLIPFSFSNIKDRKLHTDFLIQTRSSIKNYYLSSALTCYIGTFLCFFVPLLLEIIINQIFMHTTGVLASGFSIYSYNGAASLTGANAVDTVLNPGFTLIDISVYFNHPLLYNILYALLFSLFMGLLSAVAYGFSFYMKKNIFLFFPLYIFFFLLRQLGNMFSTIFEKSIDFDFFDYLTVGNNGNLSIMYFILLICGAVLALVYMLYQQIRKDQGL